MTRKQRQKRYQARYRVAHKEAAATYRQKHKKKHKKYYAAYRKRNLAREAARTKRHYIKNKKKINARGRRWRKKNPERCQILYRKGALKRKYGITINEFEAFRLAQKNCCRICKRPFDKTPNVDHSHKTGAVRGLLCRRCNIGLGMFEDSLKSLESAVNYMKETER